MNSSRLILRSLLHYWRTNLAVLLGVVAGTSVIGGALLVGDSVRESLRQITLRRLGGIDHALHGSRFFREELAKQIGRSPEFQSQFAAIVPVLLVQGRLERQSKNETLRATKLNVYGVDERLWDLTEHGAIRVPRDRDAVLSSTVAAQLRAQPGDTVALIMELPSSIPRDTLLGQREEQTKELELTVSSVLDERAGIGRLDLNASQRVPSNVFVPLATLQSLLELSAERIRLPAERRVIQKPARVNGLFVATRPERDADRSGATAPAAAARLTSMLSQQMTLEDLSLRVRSLDRFKYLSLESDQMILETAFERASRQAAEQLGLPMSPVLVYLANEIANPAPNAVDYQNKTGYSAYSVIAGLDLSDQPPFGPFEFETRPGSSLSDSELILNDKLARELRVQVGDAVRIRFFEVGNHGELPEQERTFQVRGIVKLDGLTTDRGLTPEVRGITDVEQIGDWDDRFPVNQARLTDADNAYWDEHRATPKAFLSLAAAQTLWASRYGQLTSCRIAPRADATLDETAATFNRTFLSKLDPQETGLVFRPVKYEGLVAAQGANNFAGLFFGFSLFLILSAAILIGLLFRLGIERRGTSIGLLSAVGLSPRHVRRLFLAEGLAVVTCGGALGCLGAIGYAAVMLYGLKTRWNKAVGTQLLELTVSPLSLAAGFGISVIITLLVVVWALRQLRQISIRELLSGTTQQSLSLDEQRGRGRRAGKIAVISGGIGAALLAAALIPGLVPDREAFSGLHWPVVLFFVVGTCLLIASLALLSAWLDADRSAAVLGTGLRATRRLGMRNAARHRQRSVWTAGLIATATFLIVVVAAAYRDPASEVPDRNSGNGGFTLVAETTKPILPDINAAEGRRKLGLEAAPDSPDSRLLAEMQVLSFRVKPGEEASCRNLYQTRLPTILGVPDSMIDRGGFKFAGTPGGNPWKLLQQPLADEDGVPVVPVLGDMNTLQYSLKKGRGTVISVPELTKSEVAQGRRPRCKLKVSGMFDGSVFQGVLLMSEANFQRLFTDQEAGYSYFLIADRSAKGEPPELTSEDFARLSQLLESKLPGFDAERVGDRIKAFLEVQNTYLETFQALGGLGLLLGTFGLATVMLRNVLERRSELALLRAVGFRNTKLGALVLWENAFLLTWGLAAGTMSALLAMLPHILSTGGTVPWTAALTLVAIFVFGMTAALLAVSAAVRTPIVSTLRGE